MKNKFNIAFVGMSHLGLNSAVASSNYVRKILCIDPQKEKIDKIKNFKLDYGEPGLTKRLKQFKNKFFFSTQFNLLERADLIYLATDTKTDKNNVSNFSIIRKLFKKIIKNKNKKTPVIILSQVFPGFTENLVSSKNKEVYYQVETLIFGKALSRATHPERIIVGCDDEKREFNKKYHDYLKKFKCKIIKTNYQSAELTKIAINLFLISSVTLSNSLAEISKKLNADWNKISSALKLDKRIGPHAYLKPGLGISGGNLERDLENILKLVKFKKVNSVHKKLFLNFKYISNHMSYWVERKINKILSLKKIKNIGILGISYKENTNSIKNSRAVEIIKKYSKKINIFGYDPLAKINNVKNFTQLDNINEIIKKTEVIIIMNSWKQFFNLENKINKTGVCKYIIDPFAIVNKDKLKKKKIYMSLV